MSDASHSFDFSPPSLPARVEAEQSHLRLPSRPDWIQPTAEYLCQKAVLCGACLDDRIMKLQLALVEALNNSVMHGNLEIPSELKEQDHAMFTAALAARAADPAYASRLVDVLFDYDGERCQWIITDEGKGFDVERVLSRDPLDESQLWLATGRGILLMKAFLDGVRYESGGRRVILTLNRPAGAEKRRHDRAPVQQRLQIAPLRPDGTVDWEAAYEAVSRNVSAEGIAFIQQKLTASDRILIGIEQADGRPLYLPAEVRHMRTLGENVVELGCRFPVREPAPVEGPDQPPRRVADVIEDLMGRLHEMQVLHDERRSHTRVIYTERIEIRGALEGDPIVGFARDLSKGGLAMITNVPVSLETVMLALPHGKDRVPLKIRAQIVRCGKIMGGFYDVGAQFLDTE
jgi:anti-sigma regulatory factor (Ser/Thr protein kinase)